MIKVDEEINEILPKGKQHFTAEIGGFTLKKNFLDIKEMSEVLLYNLKNNKGEMVIDNVWIKKTKATKLIFDIAFKHSQNPVISFYAKITYKKSKYGVMSYLKNISGVIIHFANKTKKEKH